VSPYQQAIPFARGSHTSYKAARAVHREGTRGQKLRRLIDAYRVAGEAGLTNLEAADVTGLPLQSVCSLRASAADCGLLEKAGERIGPFGKSNQVWRVR
jgi:hypothetical protein